MRKRVVGQNRPVTAIEHFVGFVPQKGLDSLFISAPTAVKKTWHD